MIKAFYDVLTNSIEHDSNYVKIYNSHVDVEGKEKHYILLGDQTLSELSDKSNRIYDATQEISIISRFEKSTGTMKDVTEIADKVASVVMDRRGEMLHMENFDVVVCRLGNVTTTQTMTDTNFYYELIITFNLIIQGYGN